MSTSVSEDSTTGFFDPFLWHEEREVQFSGPLTQCLHSVLEPQSLIHQTTCRTEGQLYQKRQNYWPAPLLLTGSMYDIQDFLWMGTSKPVFLLDGQNLCISTWSGFFQFPVPLWATFSPFSGVLSSRGKNQTKSILEAPSEGLRCVERNSSSCECTVPI